MKKICKIIVTGWIETSFEGTEDEALEFLKNLKKLQSDAIATDLPNELKIMKKARKKWFDNMRILYFKNCYEDSQKPFQKYGLKIKIETF